LQTPVAPARLAQYIALTGNLDGVRTHTTSGVTPEDVQRAAQYLGGAPHGRRLGAQEVRNSYACSSRPRCAAAATSPVRANGGSEVVLMSVPLTRRSRSRLVRGRVAERPAG
jgi:hypothetical protein